uniref:Uncharacterized protein n=1 Tax=Chromera velia CCMP2878 TaxID=1169474 RepID=A0A0G4HBC9_9ALVE|eukprot:Cvel_924.t1-p1 / transcript=Cvel_924.t1 / gene=Cvel_924 / organism=Chromera_velia_CCMP2878 / gene_product=hypothetical protein / transcript_product=hypothetical protein / location=Cvel_scaffold29:93449-98831(+) / protein_length=799 / sequence_SO=supercontig / SO=protein_coding / is_pseudo=false
MDKMDAAGSLNKEEMERLQTKDNGLVVILKHMGLSAENEESGKTSVDPPQAIDLSDTFGLSAKKIFFLLEGLPDSVAEVKLGNLLGFEGFRTLAEGIREGKAASLRALDLEETGLKGDGLKVLCKAIKERGLMNVEELNLSANPSRSAHPFSHGAWVEEEMEAVCSLLSLSCMPSLRVFLLRECGLHPSRGEQFASGLGRGDLPNLEVLDMEGNDFESALGCFAKALCEGGTLAVLTDLNVFSESGVVSGVSEFLSALKSENCAQLRHVKVCFREVESEKELRALGEGLYPSVRTLSLESPPSKLVTFLKALLESSAREGDRGAVLDALDLSMDCDSPIEEGPLCECLRLLGEGIRRGWLRFLRKLKIEREEGGPGEDGQAGSVQILRGVFAEAKSEFFSALYTGGHVLSLSELSLSNLEVSDADMILLAERVKGGCLPNFRLLDLASNRGAGCFGRQGMEALMKGVVESENGLPFLETLNLSDTRAGEGAASLGTALLSGKLPRLSFVYLYVSNLTDEGLGGLANAVRGGALVGVRDLDLSFNEEVGEGAWRELMYAIRDSEKGLPKLKFFKVVSETNLGNAGGPMIAALGSGKLPSLESVGGFFDFSLDAEGVAELADAVRAGKFAPLVHDLGFFLREGVPALNLDRLIRAIGESEKGLPSCLSSLRFEGGRVGEETLAFLGSSEQGAGGSKFSPLEFLDLSDCALHDSSLRRLAEVFSKHGGPKFMRLQLGRNRISVQGFEAFRKALRAGCLPNLQTVDVEDQEGTGKEDEETVTRMAIKARQIVPWARENWRGRY